MYTKSYPSGSILPTINMVKSAFKKADVELPHRDMRDLMIYLQDMAEHDGVLRNLIRIRRVGVNAFGWQIVSEDDSLTEQAEQATARLKKVIKNILKHHTDCPMYGSIALKIEWEKIGSDFIPKLAKHYKPFEINRDEILDNIILQENGDGAIINMEKEAPENWIIDVDESNKAGGVLRSILIRAIIAKDMEMEWANFLKMIKGLIQMIVGDTTSKEDMEAAQEALENVINRKFTITDELTKMEFHEVTSALGATAFNVFLERIQRIFSQTIIGNANLTEIPSYGGSRAAMWVLKTITADIIFDDINRCESMINDQLLLADYRLNYKKEALEAPWTFSLIIPEDIDLEKRIAVIEGCQRAGIALKSDDVYNTLEFTKPDGVEDVMFLQSTIEEDDDDDSDLLKDKPPTSNVKPPTSNVQQPEVI